MPPRARVALLIVALAVPSLILGLAAAPATTTPSPAQAPRELWIPPGVYTGIVVVSSAQKRRWVVALSSNENKFPIAVAPAASVIIPFERGWEVHANDNARIIIDGVDTDVPTSVGLLTNESAMAITAWGISPTGPIPFLTR